MVAIELTKDGVIRNVPSKNDDKVFFENTIKTILTYISRPQNVYWSWGVTNLAKLYINNMPTLLIYTNGYLHKGWVGISYNEGKDLFEVFKFKTYRNQKALNSETLRNVEHYEEIFFDELHTFIDTLVENNDNEAYKHKVAEQYGYFSF